MKEYYKVYTFKHNPVGPATFNTFSEAMEYAEGYRTINGEHCYVVEVRVTHHTFKNGNIVPGGIDGQTPVR